VTDPLNTQTLRYQINRARFVGRDYYTLLDDLLAFLRENYADAFNDFVASDQGVMLMELVSWAFDSLAFGQDRYATESYIDTARTRRAINRLARQLGYKMVPSAASSVDLSINLQAVWAFDVTIPVGFQFEGPNGLIFEVVGAVTFLAGEGPSSPPRTVTCREGTTVAQNFRSDGTKDQRFRLNPGTDKNVAQGTSVVKVGGVTWTEAVDFLAYEPTDQYEIDYNSDPPLLKFGNGTAGNVPSTGVDIAVTFLATSGQAGRVPAGTITDVVVDLVVAFQTIGLTITNPDPSSAGQEREDVEVTRRNVPGYFAARDVAVTHPDYLSLGSAFTDPVSGAVAVAQAFITTSADDDTVLQVLLTLIRTTAHALEAQVLAQTAVIDAQLTVIDGAEVDAAAASGNIATEETNAQAASAAVRTNIGSARAQQTVVQGNATAGVAAVAAIPVGPDRLTAPTAALLTGYYTGANAAAATADADLVNALTSLGLIDSAVEAISVLRAEIDVELAAINAAILVAAPAVTAIEALVSSGFENTIDGYLTDIFTHVDGFLSSVCKANLVTVQILALDNDGFYVAPSTALVNSLRMYLETRREITQVISVVSGESGLVAADITGVIGVLTGYVHSTVQSHALEKVYDLLRRRSGGASLRISDLDRETVPKDGIGGVEGVAYANWRIVGPVDHIDADGNLIISDSEVITRGTITLTPEDAT
jgi:hypothetical protein